MLQFEKSDLKMLLTLWRMTLRDKYLGSRVGGLWAILNPLLLLTVYTVVFGFIYQTRGSAGQSSLEFALWLVAGMGPWMATSEGLVSAAHSIVSGSSMIKNLSFKPELLTLAHMLTCLVTLTVTICFVLVLKCVFDAGVSLQVLLLAPLILIHLLLMAGVSWTFAAANVFFRDFGHMLPNALQIFLFATPIFYPLNAMPVVVQPFARLNPAFVLVESYRAVLLDGKIPSVLDWAMLYSFALIVFFGGLIFFRRFRVYFESFI